MTSLTGSNSLIAALILSFLMAIRKTLGGIEVGEAVEKGRMEVMAGVLGILEIGFREGMYLDLRSLRFGRDLYPEVDLMVKGLAFDLRVGV